MHELMHAAGFWHEQSRADRDEHITINWSNIQSGMEFNFLKYDLRKIDHLGAKYDTCSVMHYGAYAFAKVSGPTRSIQRISAWTGISRTDNSGQRPVQFICSSTIPSICMIESTWFSHVKMYFLEQIFMAYSLMAIKWRGREKQRVRFAPQF